MKRAKWKGPFIQNKIVMGEKKLPLLPRNCEITSQLSNISCEVHSGKEFKKVIITNEMIGHKLGEFVPSRKKFVFKKK